MDTTELDDAKYVALTTYKRDGTGVPAAMWITGSGGTYTMTTQGDSWKAKRIRNNPKVELCVSDSKGKPSAGATRYAGTARILEGADADRIAGAVKAKYGLMSTMISVGTKVVNMVKRKPADNRVGLEITLDWGAGGDA